MSEQITFLIGLILGSSLIAAGFYSRFYSLKKIGQDILDRAQKKCDADRRENELTCKEMLLKAKEEISTLRHDAERRVDSALTASQQFELEAKAMRQQLDKKEKELQKVQMQLDDKKLSLIEKEQMLVEAEKKIISELESLSDLSSLSARELLLQKIDAELALHKLQKIREGKEQAEQEAEREAKRIIATAICRLAVPCTSQATTRTVLLPSEEMKGRIIGREGKNIRTFERLTGVNLVIDDTPSTIVVSGTDPNRLEIARLALLDLIREGRIHPTRIEESLQAAAEQFETSTKERGQDAAARIGAINLHPHLQMLLGKLSCRFSYSQNVLEHSLEVAHIMGLMAEELGLDEKKAKRIGLLHDIGKAIPHETPGSHALIGHDLALKYGESTDVANGIGCHHSEMEPLTVEAALCRAADAMSGSRPGARIEAVGEYIRRIKDLEELAYDYACVQRAFALQAGRELRVIVFPDKICETEVKQLACDLSKKIETTLNFRSKVKVTVIRELQVSQTRGKP